MISKESEDVQFDFISSEEQWAVLKSHKASFEMFAGFNNRTSGFLYHPKRKPVYEAIGKYLFAQWNESLRLDNDFSEVALNYRCNVVFGECFRRKVQKLEFAKILRDFNKLHKEALLEINSREK